MLCQNSSSCLYPLLVIVILKTQSSCEIRTFFLKTEDSLRICDQPVSQLCTPAKADLRFCEVVTSELHTGKPFLDYPRTVQNSDLAQV